MTQDNGCEQLPEDRRKELFLALVDAQDHEMSVAQSRMLMAQRFGVNESQVRQIEREGTELQWPPLADGNSLSPSPSQLHVRDKVLVRLGGRT